jgi:hypothetical protein
MTFTTSDPPTQAATIDPIALAKARFPRLSGNGLYPGGIPQPIQPDQIAVALEFLSRQTPTKTPRISSYALKHCAEHWAGRYISNGSLITAAVQLGLVVRSYPPWWIMNPNVQIGVSRRDVRKTARARA